jgi:hypothetical protein
MESPATPPPMEVDSPRSSDTESGQTSDAVPVSPSQPPQDVPGADAPAVEVIDPKKLENEQAKAMLQRPDAIFEPDCFQHLRKYISTGGSPVEVIQMLEGGYIGYPQMCNLVCYWLKVAGVSEEEIEAIVYEYVKKSVLEKFDVAKTDVLFQHLQVRASFHVNPFRFENNQRSPRLNYRTRAFWGQRYSLSISIGDIVCT